MNSPKTDTAGRPYAQLSKMKAGDKVEADGGFTCIDDGAVLEIEADDEGELFVPCAGAEDEEGSGPHRHYIRSQADDGETLIGLYPAAEIAA